jgi:MFS family permease
MLPLASYLLVYKWSCTGRAKDLWLARASCVLATFGAFTIGLAGEPAVMSVGLGLMTLGSGYNLVVRSLLASTVEKNHVGTMYTVIGTIETVGILVSGPLLAITFRVGMEVDGGWLGLPYIVAGLLLSLAAVTVCLVRVSRLEPQQADMDRDHEEQSR